MKKCERTGNTYHVSDVRWTQGGHRGAVPNYKYMCNKQVSYQSSGVLAILWTSWVLPSDKALDDKSSTLIECEPLPPTFTSCLPDVTHVISVPRPSTFFAALNSAAMYYTECKQKNQKQGRPGNKANYTYHDIYFSAWSRYHDCVLHVMCPRQLQIFILSIYLNYHNNLLPYKVAVESAACLWGILVTHNMSYRRVLSLNCRSKLYQSIRMKSTPEK